MAETAMTTNVEAVPKKGPEILTANQVGETKQSDDKKSAISDKIKEEIKVVVETKAAEGQMATGKTENSGKSGNIKEELVMTDDRGVIASEVYEGASATSEDQSATGDPLTNFILGVALDTIMHGPIFTS